MVDEYIERHLKAHANHPDRAVKDAHWTADHYLAAWKPLKLSAIRRRDVRHLHERLGREGGHYTANRVLQFLKTVFNFGIDQELFHGENPATGIKLFHEVKRERYVTRDEMPRLFEALKTEENPDLVDFVCLALWTGARKSDIYSMRWQDVSLDDNRWAVPNPKNNTPYTIALTREVVEILRKRQNNSTWVFPSHGRSGHVMGLKRRWKELLKRAGIENLRQHDLRRTLGSWQAAGGASLTIIGKSLGHVSLGATAVYARLDLDPVRESVTAATTEMIRASKRKPKPKQLVAAVADA